MGEDPYLVSMLGTAYVRGLQSAGVIATLKHFAGYSASRGGPQPRPGADGPARADRRDPAAVRDGGRAWPAAGSVMNSYSDVDGVPAGADPWLLTEVLRDDVGLHRHGGLGLLGGALPGHACTASPPTSTGPARSPWRPASTSSCRTPSASARAGRAGAPAASCRGARRPGRPAGAHPEGRARPARPGLDPRGLGRRGPTRSTSTPRPTARSPARWPSESIVLLDAGTALPLLGERPAARRAVAVVGPARGRPAHLHGLLRLPQPRAAALPRPRVSASRCRAALDALRAELPGREVVHGPRLRGERRRPVRASPRPSRRPAAADVCVAVVGDLAGLFGHGTSGEGCDADDLRLPGRAGATWSTSCSRPARRWSSSWSPAARTRWATCTAGPPAWCRRSCPARRAAPRSPACSPAGSSRAASCRCRSRGTRAASRAPTSSRRSGAEQRRHQQPGPDAAVPLRVRRAPTPRSRSTTCGSATTRCRPTAS